MAHPTDAHPTAQSPRGGGPGARASIARLSAARWRIAIALTAAMMVVYFGFILLVAFNKPLLAKQIAPGMTLGIALGAGVIVTAWALIGVYTRWANRHYDAEVARLREQTRA